jgi:ABC-type dipeptide/oligopeptide/nickel transport system permease component
MLRYLTRRAIHSVFVLLGVSLVVFGVAHLTGDPAALMLPPDASREQLAQFRHDMGYDRPLIVQYTDFLTRALRGDFGASLWTKQPAISLVLERLPATLELACAAMIFSIVVAFPLGMLSATHRGSVGDRLAMVVAVLGQSMPVFWLGLALIMLFGENLRLLPVGGRGTPAHLVLPTFTLGAYFAARNARILRSSLLETLGQEYVRTARAKGLFEQAVLWRHALRNALISVLTLLGLQFGALLGGAIVTETVFAWPGLGRLIVESITHRDFPLLQTSALFISLVFMLLNIAVDLLYTAIDPRIRLER